MKKLIIFEILLSNFYDLIYNRNKKKFKYLPKNNYYFHIFFQLFLNIESVANNKIMII